MNVLILSGDLPSLKAHLLRFQSQYNNCNTFQCVYVLQNGSCKDIETNEFVPYADLHARCDYIFFGDNVSEFAKGAIAHWRRNGLDETKTTLISYASNKPDYLERWTGEYNSDLGEYLHDIFTGMRK